MNEPIEDGPQVVDLSRETREWSGVVPDLWFYPNHVRGREVALRIKTAEAEVATCPDVSARPFLTFYNDPKKLGLSREMRLVLESLFGTPAASIGKWIPITAGLNAMRSVVVKILPRATVEPVTEAAGGLTPPRSEGKKAATRKKASTRNEANAPDAMRRESSQ